MNSLSLRVEKQLEQFNENKDHILKLLKEIEQEYDISIVFASETGSRAMGNDVEDSDFDVSGFFITKEENYFKLFPKFDKTIKVIQKQIELNNKVYEFDVELCELKDWLYHKVTKNQVAHDYWFTSPLVYIDLFPEITEDLKNYLIPPHLVYLGKAKSGIGYNEKDIKNKSCCVNKLLMNVFTSSFQYLHTQLFHNFPNFNIFDEIAFILDNKNKIIEDNLLSENEFEIITKNAELYSYIFEEKKKNRKSTRENIPEEIYSFLKLLEEKFSNKKKNNKEKDKTKEKDLFKNLLEVEKAQEIFDYLLSKIK
jgi:predicted nucleotidyltransferase